MPQTNIGARMFVATAAPATNDAAGFEALTWEEVNGLQTAFQLGSEHSMIDSPNVSSGRTTALKGAVTGVSSTATFARVDSDTGQTNIRTLAEAPGEGGIGSVKIVAARGTPASNGVPAVQTGDRTQYAFGVFSGFVENAASSDTEDGFSVNFQQNADTVVAAHPAV